MPYQAAPGQINDAFLLTMFFNFKHQGWSEKYVLNGPAVVMNNAPPPVCCTNYNAAYLVAKDGCEYRAKLMAKNVSMVWARISCMKLLRDSFPAIQTPLHPSPLDNTAVPGGVLETADTIESLNDPCDGIMYRFDTGFGPKEIRLFRGVRDSWIFDKLKTFGGQIPADQGGGAFVAEPVAPAMISSGNAIKNFLNWMVQNCSLGKIVKGEPDKVGVWPLAAITFRGVGTRKTGRPFGTPRGRAAART